jgi:hypothetical protein
LTWRDRIRRILSDQASPSRDPEADSPLSVELSHAELALAERWRALIRYDDDIRDAAERLAPYGEHWINELGRGHFALNENKDYLPNIVSRLLDEAEADQRRQRREEAERWILAFRRTADGEMCTDEAMSILSRARAQGFTVGVERDGAFSITKAGVGTSYLRSNYDILEFSRWRLENW